MDTKDIIAMRLYGEGLDNDSQYWTDKDKKRLEDDFAAGVGITEIALELKRSEPAIVQMLMKGNHFRTEIKPRNRSNRGRQCICGRCNDFEFCLYSPKNRDKAPVTESCPKEANTDHV